MFNLDPSTLLASMIWGAIGSGFVIYGKKQSRMPVLVGGLALCAFTFFIYQPVAITIIGFLVLGGVYAANKFGM